VHPSRRKGIAAEREVAALLSDLLGVKVTRRYNLGTHEDIGDLILQDTVIQVVNAPSDTLRAVREKPLECEAQRKRAFNGHWMACTQGYHRSPAFAATFVRLRGGEYRVVLTPEQWATYWREAVD
jgi:hypothetical protein